MMASLRGQIYDSDGMACVKKEIGSHLFEKQELMFDVIWFLMVCWPVAILAVIGFFHQFKSE